MRGDLARPEQVFQRQLGFAPSPPAALALLAGLDRRNTGRTLIADQCEHLAAEARALAAEASDVAPRAVAVFRAPHAPAQQRLQLDGQQRGLVPPVFEQLAA